VPLSILFSNPGKGELKHDRLSLKHFIGNSIRELTDIEHSNYGRLTFALVFRPGFLTNEYFAGRKSRYLTPLTVSLIIFALSLIGVIYLFFALRTVYKQSSVVTLLKTALLYVGSYLIILSIMLGTLILAYVSVIMSSR
jgi:hypothetical protein